MTLYDVNDATQSIYDAVGENVETNIIFGAVTDPSMNGKIRVTVIATGFNEEKIQQKREERSAIKLTAKMPGKKSAESQAEQLSFPLHASSQREEKIVEETETAEIIPGEKVPLDPIVCDETQKAVAGALTSGGASSGLEFPAFLKKEKIKKDPHFVVSKGNIIEHYEDDMDVPTFLRKQMQ
jgi:hypothetical protein